MKYNPETRKTTDDEGKEIKLKPFVRTTPKVGRNKKCPCGSGVKSKKCLCQRTVENG